MVEVDTHEFRFSHGKAPRGFGQWAFFFDNSNEPVFAPHSSFADARRWAVAEAKAGGHSVVRVGS